MDKWCDYCGSPHVVFERGVGKRGDVTAVCAIHYERAEDRRVRVERLLSILDDSGFTQVPA